MFGGFWCSLVLRWWAWAVGVDVARVDALLGSASGSDFGLVVSGSAFSRVGGGVVSGLFSSSPSRVSGGFVFLRSRVGGGCVGVGFGVRVRGWGRGCWLVAARCGSGGWSGFWCWRGRVGVGWFGWCGGVGGCARVGGVGGLCVPGVCAGWVGLRVLLFCVVGTVKWGGLSFGFLPAFSFFCVGRAVGCRLLRLSVAAWVWVLFPRLSLIGRLSRVPRPSWVVGCALVLGLFKVLCCSIVCVFSAVLWSALSLCPHVG